MERVDEAGHADECATVPGDNCVLMGQQIGRGLDGALTNSTAFDLAAAQHVQSDLVLEHTADDVAEAAGVGVVVVVAVESDEAAVDGA